MHPEAAGSAQVHDISYWIRGVSTASAVDAQLVNPSRAQSSKVPGTVYFCGARQRVMPSDLEGEGAFDHLPAAQLVGASAESTLEALPAESKSPDDAGCA
jgi:hypothetical protein